MAQFSRVISLGRETRGVVSYFFFQAEDGIRDVAVTGVQTCALPIFHVGGRALARQPALLLICPRYEGVDERVTAYVDEELSIGDYVLTGGETAALVEIGRASCRERV